MATLHPAATAASTEVHQSGAVVAVPVDDDPFHPDETRRIDLVGLQSHGVLETRAHGPLPVFSDEARAPAREVRFLTLDGEPIHAHPRPRHGLHEETAPLVASDGADETDADVEAAREAAGGVGGRCRQPWW